MWWQQQQKKKVHQKFDDFRNCSNGSPNLLMKQYHSTVVKKRKDYCIYIQCTLKIQYCVF